MNISNTNEVVIFDESGWLDSEYAPIETLKNIISGRSVESIKFYNVSRMICVRMDKDYYFRSLNNDMLELMCEWDVLRSAVKDYCLHNKYFSCNTSWPQLMATILGNNVRP
jgi:hypothetical protein